MADEAHRLTVVAVLAHEVDIGTGLLIFLIERHFLNRARLDHVTVDYALLVEDALALSFADVNLLLCLPNGVLCQVILDK